MSNILTFRELKKNIKKPKDGFASIKVAILGDTSTQLLNTAIAGFGVEKKVAYKIYEADYDMIEQEVFNTTSELYQFEPEIVILAPSTEKLLLKFQKTQQDKRRDLANEQIEKFNNLYSILEEHLKCKVCLLYTSPSPRDATLSRMPSSA